jgi:putative redox protein
MNLTCNWQDKMHFTAQADPYRIEMDASPPLGSGEGPTPKQLLLAGICGCTGMDVVALLRKYKQPYTQFSVDAEATMTEGAYPIIFRSVVLVFKIAGEVDPARLLEAVRLSQTRYCAVSAMVSKAVPISYRVELNGTIVGEGRASFPELSEVPVPA